MKDLELTIQHRDGSTQPLTYTIERVANCGLAVDEEIAQAHLDEMKEKGIVITEDPPIVYQLPTSAVSNADRIETNDTRTSGEAEYVLYPTDDEVYLGVASDHTDRALEEDEDIVPKSKTICPNVVSTTVWPLSEIESHWDTLELSSWTGTDGSSQLYQDTDLGVFYRPSRLMDTVAERSSANVEGTAVFSGTVEAIGEMVFGDFFAARIHDPILDRSLHVEYDVHTPDWLQPR